MVFFYLSCCFFIVFSREDQRLKHSHPIRLTVCMAYVFVFMAIIQRMNIVERFSLDIGGWSQTGDYHRYGHTLAYYVCKMNSKISKPENYSVERIEELVSAYETSKQDMTEYPDIIVVMNETFADLGDIGEMDTNKDYMPFLHSLSSKDDFAVGRVLVPVYGGKTCNSEWEFLTGYSLEFTPQIIPYAVESFDNSNTLCSVLENQGYHTIATHPEAGTNYRRNSVYKQMGFDEIYFKDDYSDYECLRGQS